MVTCENKIHIQSCMSAGLWCPAQRQAPARGQHRQQHKEVATAGPISSVYPCRRVTLWVSFTGGGSGGRRPRPVRPEVLRRRPPYIPQKFEARPMQIKYMCRSGTAILCRSGTAPTVGRRWTRRTGLASDASAASRKRPAQRGLLASGP